MKTYYKATRSEKNLETAVERSVRKVQSSSVKNYSKGYCMRFIIPETEIMTLLIDVPGISIDQIKSAFISQWQIPNANAPMYGNAYYHLLSLIMYFGVMEHNDRLAKNALALILYKLWNGRNIQAFKWCDPDTMAYVISKMSKKFEAKKHATPLELINNYSVPTIYKKYSSTVRRNSDETKRIFNASFARLRQMYRSDSIVDLESGKPKYKSGIQILYYKANKEGLKLSTISTNSSGSDEDFDLNNILSSHSFDDRIETITTQIVISKRRYPREFMTFLSNETSVKKSTIEVLVNSIHSNTYSDHIHEIIELIFKRIQSSEIDRSEICSRHFLSTFVKRKIISSKHTPDVDNIKKIVDNMLEDILSVHFNEKLKTSSRSSQDFAKRTAFSHMRRVLIYTFAYNFQLNICSGE